VEIARKGGTSFGGLRSRGGAPLKEKDFPGNPKRNKKETKERSLFPTRGGPERKKFFKAAAWAGKVTDSPFSQNTIGFQWGEEARKSTERILQKKRKSDRNRKKNGENRKSPFRDEKSGGAETEKAVQTAQLLQKKGSSGCKGGVESKGPK